jgi:hypothetical protein
MVCWPFARKAPRAISFQTTKRQSHHRERRHPEPRSHPGAPEHEFQRIDIVDEMKTSYLDYAMSVIVGARFPMCATG